MGKVAFNSSWMKKYPWATHVKDNKYRVYCKFCRKSFELGKMGERAIVSHSNGAKHKAHSHCNERSSPMKLEMTDFCSKLKTEIVSDVPDVSRLCVPPAPTSMTSENEKKSTKTSVASFMTNQHVTKAEIIWTLKTVTDHGSYHANNSTSAIFKEIFPDSEIAAKFACGENKTAYMTVFGIAPYFVDCMKKRIKGDYVVLFDESLNKKGQSKQMDIHLRYWDDDKRVKTSYMGSEFLGHGTAANMLDHFKKGVLESGLKVRGVLQQVSMDGPNVNWAFYRELKKDLQDNHDWSLLNIGSCGLHTVHNSFKAGGTASKWEMNSFLSSLYYLFKDSPARREDFKTVTSSDVMPLKFANHRWLENVSVCNRAILLLPALHAYVSAVKEKKITKPTCHSYTVVHDHLKDKLLVPKLMCFKFIANQLEPFLTTFQTDHPMVPFLGSELSKTVRSLMKCFISHEKVDETADEKLKNLFDKTNYLSVKKMDIGMATDKELKEVIKKKEVSERQVLEFRMQSRDFLEAGVNKILEKSPLTYSLVRNLSCLDPQKMASNAEECRSNFRKVLTTLSSFDRITDEDCDVVVREYNLFLEQIPVIGSHTFTAFNPKLEGNRLDDFFCTYMSENTYPHLLKIVKMLLVRSHGQASVERGFSINKEIEVENMKERTLVAHRVICDAVKDAGGVLKVKITDGLYTSVKLARQRYNQFLDKQKETQKDQEAQRKRKLVTDQLEVLQAKKTRLQTDIVSLTKSADDFADKAENTSNLTFLTKSNSFRRTAKEKKLELNTTEEKIQLKLDEVKTVSAK